MPNARIICAVLSGILACRLAADVSVTVGAPKLNEGMASLETMIAAETAFAAQEIARIAEGLADKPRFLEGFSSALAVLALLPGANPSKGQWQFGLGSAAALVSEVALSRIAETMALFDGQTDLVLGFSTQPLSVSMAAPLSRLLRGRLPGVSLGLGFGYVNHQLDELLVRSAGITPYLAYEMRPAIANDLPAWLSWTGLRLALGYSLNRSTLAMLVQPGPIVQTIPLDPDGAGPLAALPVVLSMDPEIMVGITSNLQQVKLQLSSALELFNIFRFNAGFGYSLQWGSSAVSLAMDQAVTIDGYLSSLISEPGRISIEGAMPGAPFYAGTAFILLAPAFLVGDFSISIPCAWQLPGRSRPSGLSLALLLELAF